MKNRKIVIIQLSFIVMLLAIGKNMPIDNFTLLKGTSFLVSVDPKSDRIEWRYERREDGKLYKRLFNYSTASWIGDWILVG